MGNSRSKPVPTVAESLEKIANAEFKIGFSIKMVNKELESKKRLLDRSKPGVEATRQLATQVALKQNELVGLYRQETGLASLRMRIQQMQHNSVVAGLVDDLAISISNEVQYSKSPENIMVMVEKFEKTVSDAELGFHILETGMEKTQEKMAPCDEVALVVEEHKEMAAIQEAEAIDSLPVAVNRVAATDNRVEDAKSPGGSAKGGGGGRVLVASGLAPEAQEPHPFAVDENNAFVADMESRLAKMKG